MPFNAGGLNAPDIFNYNRSLKAGWIKRYFDKKDNKGVWKTMFKNKLQNVGDTLILESNINEFDMH